MTGWSSASSYAAGVYTHNCRERRGGVAGYGRIRAVPAIGRCAAGTRSVTRTPSEAASTSGDWEAAGTIELRKADGPGNRCRQAPFDNRLLIDAGTGFYRYSPAASQGRCQLTE